MKMSAWIRFCLIVLCLAMACSMFACNTPEEQTTEAPVVDTTEAPSDEPTTEKPTEKPTETPTEVTTEEPVVTTEPTEVTTEPTEVTTEPTEVTTEPTEVTTEPTEVTTEVPATETTEAPATETTEAPETETTETETTPSEVETATDITIGGDVIEEGDSGYIEEAVSPYKYNCDSHGGAVGSTFTTKIDPLTGIITGIKGWFAVEPGVMAYKYALVIDGVQQDMVDVTKANLPDGSGTVGYDRSDVVNHVAKNYPGFNASVAGHNIGFNFTHVLDYATLAELHGHSVEIKYYAVIFKVDVEGNRYVNENEEYEEGAYVLLATFKDIMPEHFGVRGYRNNGDGTHSILCQACDVYYATEQCPAAKGEGATWVDTNSHSGMTCTLCGQTGVKGAHTAPTNTIWNSETNSYETILNPIVWNDEAKLYWSQCVACGGQVGEMFPAIIDMQAEDMKLGQPSWATKQINITDLDGTACASITKMLFSGADGWSNSYFYINPLQIGTGRYMAIRYRIMLADGDRSLGIRTDTNNGNSGTVNAPLVNDGKWHIVVVDLASAGAFAPDANGNYIMSNLSRLDFTSWTAGDIILLDWFKTYDSLDAIILEQDACECPNFALEGVATGAEGHTPTCKFCGKEFALTAHTPSPWGRYDAEAGKYVSDCTVCGYTCDVFGNVVFSGDALAGVSSSLTKEATDDGVKFTNSNNGDKNFTLFQGMSGKETGKYLFMKYRANGVTGPQIFSATDAAAPTGSRNGKPTIDNDGEWHIAVVDMTKVVSTYPAGADGKYYIQHFRMDVEGSEGCWIEIAYIGFASDPIALAKSIKALDPAAVEICECPATISEGTFIDIYTHEASCALCGKSFGVVEHNRTVSHGTWDEDAGTYLSATPCSACGGRYDVYFNVLTTTKNTAVLNGTSTIRLNQSDDTSDAYMYFEFDKGTTGAVWKPVAINCNLAGAVSGQYMVVKYRVPAEYAQGYRFEMQSANSPSGRTTVVDYGGFVADDEWHIIIVDLASFGAAYFGANADGTYTVASTMWVQPSYSPLTSGSMDIEYIAFADDLDRLFGGIAAYDDEVAEICVCPAIAETGEMIDGETHTLVCGICGADKGTGEHDFVVTNCTDDIYCKVCGYTTAGPGHTLAGSNNEYCTTCKQFVNVDVSTAFNFFVGGENLPYVTSLGSMPGANGYRVYSRTTAGETTPSIAVSGETGQFMVIKYKATGSFNFEFFQSTVQASAKGGWSVRHIPSVYDEWQYYIVDLTKVLPADAMVAVNGTYSIKGLRLDLQSNADAGDLSGTGTAEVAYIAYANSIEKLVDGILALEGVENIKNDYCLCDEIIQTGVYADENTHIPTCALCGVQGEAAPHAKGTHGVWNEELGFYAYECDVCGAKLDYGCTVGGEAEDLFTNLNQWSLNRTVQDGFVNFKKTGTAVFCATYFAINPNGVATGKYIVIRYRANSAEATLFCLKYTSAGEIAGINIVSDGEWHTAIVELKTDFTSGDVRLMLYHPDGTARGWAQNDSLDIDWVKMYDSYDRIPAEYKPAA